MDMDEYVMLIPSIDCQDAAESRQQAILRQRVIHDSNQCICGKQ